MKLGDLVNEIKNGNDEYYLTTQYDFDDPDRTSDEEDEGEEKEDEDEEDVEEGGVPFDQFSDTSSIDMNNLMMILKILKMILMNQQMMKKTTKTK